ncbi:hypothetical protein K4U80_03615 [Staphylococcus epidermidis]|nr:hypothetical protein [Staphylococcus epidermidis]MCG1991676.1 hypothetical protein [Staphylococcus epidermidis]MCG1996039.1 hypothetical protein [Staphylococcus epidermidis]
MIQKEDEYLSYDSAVTSKILAELNKTQKDWKNFIIGKKVYARLGEN